MTESPDWLDLAMSLPADAPNVIASPERVAECLWEYGEDDLEAQAQAGLTREQQQEIAIEAGRISEGGVALPEALARAAVTVLEGAPRDLSRSKRRLR